MALTRRGYGAGIDCFANVMGEEPTPSTAPLPSTSSTSSSPSPHWSESFVEHLRTVHFALSILAVAIGFTLLSAKEYDAQKAWRQATEIRDLNEKWDKDMSLLYQASFAPEGRSQSLPASFSLWERGRNNYGSITITWDDLMSEPHWRAFAAGDKKPSSVASFKSWWNALNEGFDIPIPTMEEHSVRPCSTRRFLSTTRDPKKGFADGRCDAGIYPGNQVQIQNSKLIRLKCDDEPEPAIRPDNYVTYCNFLIQNSDTNFEPHDVGFIAHVDQQTVIKSLFGDWSNGDFQVAFPDLSRAATPGLEYVSLEHLPDRLNEGSSADQVIEAFGLKIAASDVTRWGVLILLAAQFYFWLHLHELTQRIEPTDPGWNVAWIGIYQPWLAFITVIVSACALPIAAASLAGARIHFERHPHLQLLTACAAIGASACLAISTAFKLYRLRGGRRSTATTCASGA
jgi:hypothetical protein